MRSISWRPRLKSAAVLLFAGSLVLGSAGVAQADLTPDPLRDPASESFQTLQRNVLAKAQPDACYYGIDLPMRSIRPDGTCPSLNVGTDAAPDYVDGTPKVNQAYVWGLAKSDNDRLWWGTGPNIHCLVLQGYLGIEDPVETSSYVCDPDQNFVPPDIFMYDERTGSQTDLKTGITDPAELQKLGGTLGIRSAGAAKGVVFFAGPGFAGGINLFAFDDDTGAYLGSYSRTEFTNIRKWTVVDGELYTGVAVRPSTDHPNGGGMVLRWTGSKAEPFSFENVGFVDGEAAELAEHDGRLFVATWPCCESETVQDEAPAALWMSPLLGSDKKLDVADLDEWTKVWSATDYEPDPVVAQTYGGGALMSYGGQLYWGTMHVPGTAYGALTSVYGATYPDAMGADAYIRANRAIAIFRGDDFTDGRSDTPVELLYGDAKEWTFDGASGSWSLQPTGGDNGTPVGGGRYGPSGFGTPFNNYTWTMSVYAGQLFVGTMDHTYLVEDMLDEPRPDVSALGAEDSLLPTLLDLLDSLAVIRSGADLWRFPAPGSKAVPESLEGVGNYLNYGVRTMVGDADGLYVGSANPMNRMTDTTDQYPEGGWELIELTTKGAPPSPPPPPPPPPPASDTTAPVSKAHSPKLSSDDDLAVRYRAKDEAEGSGLASVALFVKQPGATSYTEATVDSGDLIDGELDYSANAGEGVYRFYTVATDVAGNAEAAPARADTWVRYDATPPVLHRRMGHGPFVLQLGDRLMLRMHVGEQAHATFVIRHHRQVVKQFGPKLVGKGLTVRAWSGRGQDQKLVAPARYVLVMKAEDMAGNATVLRTALRVRR